MTTQDTYSQRKQVITAQVRDLIDLRGARTAHQKTRLAALLDEADGLAEEAHRHGDADAFSAFLRGGRDGCSAPQLTRLIEARDMGEIGFATGAAAGPGILVPVGFERAVTSSMKSFSDLIALANLVDVPNGNPHPYPLDNDSLISGELLGEAQQASVADIGNPSQVILGAFRLSSKIIRLSRELIGDSEVSIDGYLSRQIGIRIARVLSLFGTIGAGGTQPTGFMNSATIINAGVAAGAGANDGTSLGNSIGVSDIANLENAVDVAYRANARFMVHPNTLQAMRAQLDKQGRPLFPGLHNSPDGVNRVMNYPIVTNPFMDQLQSTPSSPQVARKPIAFADFSRYTIRRGPLVIFRIVERWAEFDQIGFLAMQRVDANFTDVGQCAAYLTTMY